MKKKLVLLLLVFTEITVGSFFLFRYYQKIMEERSVLGVSDVATIDKSVVQEPHIDDLKYYWEYEPNTVVVDERDWLPNNSATYSINNDGFNDLNNYDVGKPQNTFRIITLGDSFTFGHYVNTEDNWTEKLESMLNSQESFCPNKNYEVLNLGMPGHDVQYIVQVYKDIGQKYNSDLIIWFENGTGFTRFNELLQPLIEDCLGNELEYETNELLTIQNECWKNEEREIMKQYDFSARKKMVEYQYDKFFSMQGINEVIFFHYENLSSEENEALESWRNKYPAKFVSLLSELKGDKLLPDGHPNPDGHDMIANQIYEYIKNNEIGCQ